MVDETAANYLRDLGDTLKAAALDARASAKATGEAFDIGRSMAYYEVVSLMLHQAEAFGLRPEMLGLADIEPDRDLL